MVAAAHMSLGTQWDFFIFHLVAGFPNVTKHHKLIHSQLEIDENFSLT